MAAESELVRTVNDKLLVTENDRDFSESDDYRVHPFRSNNDRSADDAVSVEPGGIHSPGFIASQPNLSRSKSPVSCTRRSSRVGHQPKFATARRPQRSPVLSTLPRSSSPTPPPLPKPRCSVGRQYTDKHFRPPPPIPDEAADSAVDLRKDNLFHSATLNRR